MVLRENAILPRLVNRSYEANVAEFGDTIDIPYVGLATAVTVTPGPTYTNVDMTTSKVQIALNWWRKASFVLTDKEIEEAISGLLPMRASANIKALGNAVDSFIAGLYTECWSSGGVAGTTPFASTATAFMDARKELNKWLAPLPDRRVVLDPDAEAGALGLSQFFKADERGDQGGIIDGNIGRKYGADWYMNQNIPTHTGGSLTAETTHLVVGDHATGVSALTVRGSAPSGTLVAGDLFTINGTSQQYVVATVATATGTLVTISFQPSLAVSHASGVAVTYVGTHVANLYFHPDAIAFASRPMDRSKIDGLGSVWETVVDPISGLALRLEVSRQWKQTTWVWDILGGATMVRPELCSRILG
jgi:hypothetical protein